MCVVQVVEESVADDEMVMIRGCKHAQACTVLLRGANDYMLDEVDRSLHDAFCVVKRVLEYGTVVPGESCAPFTAASWRVRQIHTSWCCCLDASVVKQVLECGKMHHARSHCILQL